MPSPLASYWIKTNEIFHLYEIKAIFTTDQRNRETTTMIEMLFVLPKETYITYSFLNI